VSADCIDDMCHAGTCFASINGCDIDNCSCDGVASTIAVRL